MTTTGRSSSYIRRTAEASRRSYWLDRGTATSYSPRRRSSSTTWLPRNPPPPVTTIRFRMRPLKLPDPRERSHADERRQPFAIRKPPKPRTPTSSQARCGFEGMGEGSLDQREIYERFQQSGTTHRSKPGRSASATESRCESSHGKRSTHGGRVSSGLGPCGSRQLAFSSHQRPMRNGEMGGRG